MSTTTSTTSKTAVFPEENEKGTGSEISEFTTQCSSCHATVDSRKFANLNRYNLKPGEYMFDFEGSTASKQSLPSFIHRLCASNVYRMFFAYTQVLQHDDHRCCTTYDKFAQFNRFSDIPCIEESRVHVKHPTGDHDYIHANWVDGYRERKKFIITQAPLPQTVDQFWKMVWQEKSLIVVSMIQTVDVPGAEWSGSYIPKTGETATHNKITLKNCGTRRVRNSYDATLIKATCEGSERRLLHFCFFAWGHRATPKKPTEILNFISDFNYNRDLLTKEAVAAQVLKQNEKSPIVLHCLAGTSRSATIAALDISFKKLDDTATKPCGAMLDVDDVVQRLRTQRAMAVQKPEQYLFLHLAVLEYAVRQRYIADQTYNEMDLDNYFYDPKRAQSRDGSSVPSSPQKRE
nr:Protein-tyrosine phosphatase domain containing protein [Haemonchus contortus]